ncbi:MAG: ferrochelatase [Nitrospirae bacterium]|nr:ferrochelatase [Nitrospirota bacterium]
MVIGIILLNLGGPDSLAAVKPFLYNLFSDRDIIRLGPSFLQKPIASLIIKSKLKKTLSAYSLIGGKSPLLDITTAQAKALEELLNQNSEPESQSISNSPSPPFRKGGMGEFEQFKVSVGMRYWHPFTAEGLELMHKKGIKKIIALSLYPHYSVATTGSSIKDFKEAAAKYPFEYSCITSWFNHPIYIDALVEKIQEGMRLFHEKPVVLFSAHSLPQKFVDAGDPYVQEIRGTIGEITKRMDIEWHLSYQSKTGPVKWLEPTTEHLLHELAGNGVKNLLVVPISFVSDHIETLYEIDMLYKEMAQGLGIKLKRTESLNTSAKFIEALADIVMKDVKNLGWG